MTQISESHEQAFQELCATVQHCRKCQRMEGSKRVLNRAAGALSATIMFIGEAPGRLGADSSEIPFHGDKAGHNFEELLEGANLSRADIFVTNAVLCNPKDGSGNNAAPSMKEISNCSGHLKRQIDLLNPKIVVTLGGTALKALATISPHQLELRQAVRTRVDWYDRILLPLYHPGQRAMIHRSFANQRADYQFVAEVLNRSNISPRAVGGKTSAEVASIANAIISSRPGISYFALHKIFYLLEWESIKKHGRPITKAYFVRQKDGPYCVDLQIQKLKKALPNLEIVGKNGQLYRLEHASDLFEEHVHLTDLDNSTSATIEEVMSRYGGLKDADLKSAVYLTTPMRNILRREAQGLNMFNSPILFSKH